MNISSLRVRLTVALLITGLSGVLIVALLMRAFTITEFDHFVLEQQRAEYVADLTAYYEAFGSWDNIRMLGGRLPLPPQSDERATVPNRPDPMPPSIQFILLDQDNRVILPRGNWPPGQPQPEFNLEQTTPIVIDGTTVGYVASIERPAERNNLEQAYLSRTSNMLWLATIGAITLALILSVLFARSLSKPLREIMTAIQAMARGNLDQQVPVRSQDEIGQVADAFNQMSAELNRANQLRRQMTADIAHELRTPLSVIAGYLAALSDGLMQGNPERFRIMHEEAQHLQHLVEDLRVLSLADAGELPLNRQWISPEEMVNLTTTAFSHQAEQQGVGLSDNIDSPLPLLYADPDRIMQVLSNLVSNALRHTPENGSVTISAHTTGKQIVLQVADTGSGIEPQHLPHVFERFYRADSARQQQEDESGLGLAIAKSIIEAHGGSITVSSTAGEGTAFSIMCPVHEAAPDHTPD